MNNKVALLELNRIQENLKKYALPAGMHVARVGPVKSGEYILMHDGTVQQYKLDLGDSWSTGWAVVVEPDKGYHFEADVRAVKN